MCDGLVSFFSLRNPAHAVLLAAAALFPALSRAAEFQVMDRLTVGGPTVVLGSTTVSGALGVGGSGLEGGTLVIRSTSATGANPVLDVRDNAGNSTAVVLENGNVGINATLPEAKLDVAGDAQFGSGVLKSTFSATPDSTTYALSLSSGVALADGCVKFADNSVQCAAAASGGRPAGEVSFFNLATCPTGWTAIAAAQGRYLVGLPTSGTLAGITGTALSNGENRSVGSHGHSISDPGHNHISPLHYTAFGMETNRRAEHVLTDAQPINTGSKTTGISVNTSGTTAGTNAPYIQFLVCEKD
ncbi:MAG: hypothetical protein COV48_11555 [Elusimicrobia bacterium CG11_big_fil_rev_8_21_14_0_20_64_6]|nr:MAG: hypothetical protein COV48_11555 [Elusimicrobia bacterium CG11_big_fil_rev_8_21_14_0_20_64_6]